MSTKSSFIIGIAHIFFEGGGDATMARELMRQLQPASCAANPDIKIYIHKAAEPYPLDPLVDILATLRVHGVKTKEASDITTQKGQAFGRRFYAAYVRKGAS